jgi:hypothetical protein
VGKVEIDFPLTTLTLTLATAIEPGLYDWYRGAPPRAPSVASVDGGQVGQVVWLNGLGMSGRSGIFPPVAVPEPEETKDVLSRHGVWHAFS